MANGRVVAVGMRAEVLDAARPGARVVDAGGAAVIPGLHDFHIHLVGLARTRSGVLLDDAPDGAAVVDRLARHAAALAPEAWVTGRGWSEAQLGSVLPGAMDEAVAGRPAFVSSHDGHSAWASAAALRAARIGEATQDPPGGRIERDPDGRPTGILRETALDLVSRVVPRLQGDALRPALDATLAELSGHGLTGVSEAGDYTDENGVGDDADMGDSYSTLTDLGDAIDGRLRLTLGMPADAIEAAAARGLRTGMALAGRHTMRVGWAKEYADGALGSGTAALFEPRSCGAGERGIMRVAAEELDALFRRGRGRGDRPGGARHRGPSGSSGARRGRTGTVAAARHAERPDGARPAGPRRGPSPLRRARRHRQRAADPRRGRPRPRRVVLGRTADRCVCLARPRRCRCTPGGRLRCAGRGGEPVARRLRRGPSAVSGRRPWRLACGPGTHHPRGAARLHARSGARPRRRRRGTPARRCARRPRGAVGRARRAVGR